MRQARIYPLSDVAKFKKNLLYWSNQFSVLAYFDSHYCARTDYSKTAYNTYECILGVDRVTSFATTSFDGFELLRKHVDRHKDWSFGHLSYDLKNEVEVLSSQNEDGIGMPDAHFFQPKYVFKVSSEQVEILYLPEFSNIIEIEKMFLEIDSFSIPSDTNKEKPLVESRYTEEEFIQTINKIKKHIQYGDIYEINLCQEFFAENISINPIEVYLKLSEISPTPFSSFYKLNDKYLLSASPERFIKKIGSKIISQPIKGTIKRGKNKQEDIDLIEQIRNDVKENAENVMIVDLVRNDLSRTAKRGSVQVEELSGIYSFKQVHQMISTVSSEMDEKFHFIDVIKNAFPMGSMTGAPKVKAMKLIEEYEKTKRGIYSGSVGYITPDGDFDFNVVIRSFVYNAIEKYLSFIVGGAITSKSDAKKEYDECLLKAEAMLKTIEEL